MKQEKIEQLIQRNSKRMAEIEKTIERMDKDAIIAKLTNEIKAGRERESSWAELVRNIDKDAVEKARFIIFSTEIENIR